MAYQIAAKLVVDYVLIKGYWGQATLLKPKNCRIHKKGLWRENKYNNTKKYSLIFWEPECIGVQVS